MNYFRITLCGESELSHDELNELFAGSLMEYLEGKLHGEIGIMTYTPTDERGEPINESIPLEFIMRYIVNHGLYTSAMEVVSAWLEGQKD